MIGYWKLVIGVLVISYDSEFQLLIGAEAKYESNSKPMTERSRGHIDKFSSLYK